jgi:hypothetical protein
LLASLERARRDELAAHCAAQSRLRARSRPQIWESSIGRWKAELCTDSAGTHFRAGALSAGMVWASQPAWEHQ